MKNSNFIKLSLICLFLVSTKTTWTSEKKKNSRGQKLDELISFIDPNSPSGKEHNNFVEWVKSKKIPKEKKSAKTKCFCFLGIKF